MQFVSAEQHSIGNILPRWHKKLVHYSQPNARLNLHFCQMKIEKRFERTGTIKHDQACYHRHHVCVTRASRAKLFWRQRKHVSKSFQVTVISRARSNFLSSYWSASEQRHSDWTTRAMTSSLPLTQQESTNWNHRRLSTLLAHHFLNNVWMYHTQAPWWSQNQ